MAAQTISMEPASPAFAAESRVPEILVGTFVPLGLASIFVLARFYSRAIIMKNWGYDDIWILFSWLISIALSVINVILTHHGAGRHSIVQDPQDLRITLVVGFTGRVMYQFVLWTIKFAICAFYSRVFQDRWSKVFVWSMMIIVSVYSLVLISGVIFQCKPIEGAWSTVAAKCSGDSLPLYASAILNIVSDIALLCFVVPKILKLRIVPRQKASLLGIACLSILAIIAATVRLVRVIQVANSHDMAWDSYDITIWTSIEVNTAIFCTSSAAIKPLVRKIAPSFFQSSPQTTFTSGSLSRRQTAMYAMGNAVSRPRHYSRQGAIELYSQTNEEDFSSGNLSTTNKVWAETNEASNSDDSERCILELDAAIGRIKKTLHVTVAVEKEKDLEIGEGDPVR